MEAFYQRLSERAATLDELLSDAFEASAQPAAEQDLSGERIAAWRRSCAAGDPSLFARRLARDGLSQIEIENRLAGARRRACAPRPQWLEDAVWVEQTLADPIARGVTDVYPFEDLFAGLIERAEALVWSGVEAATSGQFDQRARLLVSWEGGDLRLCFGV